MKRKLTHIAGIIGMAIGLTASTALAQTTANGPYYATPSWDQTLPASTRFIVLSNMNNQAVLDRETGLVWQRSPLGVDEWSDANTKCIRSTVGNRAGWRLPTINELGSVLDPSATAVPAFPSGHPFTGFNADEDMWTATKYSGSESVVQSAGWVAGGGVVFVRLGGFGTSPLALKQTWCVRGGLQPGPQ